MRLARLCLPAALLLGLGLLAPVGASGADRPEGAGSPAERAAPGLQVRRLVGGLDQPWDVQPIGGGRFLVTERDRGRLLVVRAGARRVVRGFGTRRVWHASETGLMSLAVDPGFATNRRIYTCQGGFRAGGGHDVRVLVWRLNRRATRVVGSRVLLAGLPTSSGRHGGCRLLIARDGALLVGTGDAVRGTLPRDRRSLGGKVLRLERRTGRPARGNPFAGSRNRRARYVFTYGHRNVQGLAQRRDGTLWSVEHGTDRDDEVNRLVAGGDYGWQPGARYDETAPMTDHRLPGRQRDARWRSGSPTLATSGATFVRGRRWGSLDGALAVAALKGERVLFLRFDAAGRLRSSTTPAALRRYGRLRSVTRTAGGALLITTANGGGRDVVLRVTPR